MMNRQEYNEMRKRKKAERQARKSALVIARRRQREHADEAMLTHVLDLLDNSTRPITDGELRRMGAAYLRVTKQEAARSHSKLVESDGSYYRYLPTALA